MPCDRAIVKSEEKTEEKMTKNEVEHLLYLLMLEGPSSPSLQDRVNNILDNGI